MSVRDNVIDAGLGYVTGRAPRDRGYKQALEAEIDAMRTFLMPRQGKTITPQGP